MDPPTYPFEETSFMNGPLVTVTFENLKATFYYQEPNECI